jgi:hypothetical protein
VKSPRITLTIDRLVLDGVAPSQRDAVVAALAAELEARLALPGAIQALGGERHLASAPAQPVRTRGAGAKALGSAAARGIAGALKR